MDAQAVNRYKEDAWNLTTYLTLKKGGVEATCVTFLKVVIRQKTTKAECKIIRKYISDATNEKKKEDSVKARDELEARPLLIDFSANVHPAVRACYDAMVA